MNETAKLRNSERIRMLNVLKQTERAGDNQPAPLKNHFLIKE
jgi:hypothetical protein